MRIVMPIYYFLPVMGGAEQQAHRLAGELIRRGHQVTVVTGRWRREWACSEAMGGVPVCRLPTLWSWLDKVKGFFFRHVFFELSLAWYLIRNRNKYDLIHVHQALHAAFVSSLVAKLIGKRVLVKVGCGGAFSDIRIMRENIVNPLSSYFWKAVRTCDAFAAISKEIVAELTADGIDPAKIRKIPNGISFDQNCAKESYRLSCPVHLLSIGRLDSQKAYDVLVAGLSRLGELDFRCHIYGEGEERRNLEQLIRESELDDRLFLPGVVHDLEQRLPACDLFILASRAEGLSNALLEAMMYGVPCIASAVGGNVDLLAPENATPEIRPGECLIAANGVLVLGEDPDGIVAAIRLLSADEALRERLGKSAREWVRQHYALETVAAGYIDWYAELVRKDRPGVPQ